MDEHGANATTRTSLWQTLFVAALSFVCTLFAPMGIAAEFSTSLGIWSLAIFAGLALLFSKAFGAPSAAALRLRLLPLPLALLYAAFTVAGAQLTLHHALDLRCWQLYPAIAAFTLIYYAIVALLWRFLDGAPHAYKQNNLQNASLAVRLRNAKHKWLWLWLTLFVCWLPAWIAMFPGFFNYDVGTQLASLTSGYLNALHPPLHTAFAALVGVVYILTKSWNLGVAVYVFIQLSLLSATFAFGIYKLRQWKTPAWFCLLALAYYAFFPFIVLFGLSTVKDTLFSAAVLLFAVLVTDLWREPKQFFRSPFRVIRFLLIAFLMLALRNNALYAYVLFIPFAVAFAKGFRLKLIGVLAAALAVFVVYSGPLFALVGITPGDPREKYPVPLQQLAAAVQNTPEAFTTSDTALLFRFVAPEALPNYDPHLADYVKDHFSAPTTTADKKAFWSLWARVGTRSPGVYLNAFLDGTLYAWYPDSIIDVYNPGETGTNVFDFSNSFPVAERGHPPFRGGYIPALREIYRSIATEKTVHQVPVVSLLFSIGFHFWLLLFCWFTALRRRQTSKLLPLTFILLLCLTVFLGPTMLVRYFLILFFGLPFMLAGVLRKTAIKKQ
ncbi:MAG: DUF6020 family protein [Oscillospiraceae bacterium]|nr:DUF6020 family protein [Oscillospiraceae bacterium]